MSEQLLETIRESIPSWIIEFMDDPTMKLLYLDLMPGIGKTFGSINTIIYEWVGNSSELIFGYHPPTHRIAKEVNSNPDLYDNKSMYLAGRKNSCIVKEMKQLESCGINVSSYCKTECRFYLNGCPYYDALYRFQIYPDFWIGVHSHFKTDLIRTVANEFNTQVIVLDENPIDIVEDTTNFAQLPLLSNINRLRDLDDLNETRFMVSTMQDMCNAILANDRLMVDRNRLINGLQNFNIEVLGDVAERYNDYLLQHRLQIPNLVTPLTEYLQYLRRKMKSFDWEPDQCTDVLDHSMDVNRLGRYNVFTTSSFDLTRLLGFNNKFIILDYATPPTFYSTIFNVDPSNITHRTIDFNFDNIHAVQITTGHYGKRVLTNSENSLKRMIKLTKDIVNYHKNDKILIVSFRKFTKVLEKLITEDNVSFEYYFNTRGINVYNDYNVCIVFGTPNISDVAVNRYAMHGFDQNSVRFITCEGEMLQCANRIRLVYGNKYLYLLTKKPIPLNNVVVEEFSVQALKSYFQYNDICEQQVTQCLDSLGGLSISKICSYINMPRKIVDKVVAKMERTGLVKSSGDTYKKYELT